MRRCNPLPRPDKEVGPETAMEDMPLNGQPTVLIVDRSDETLEVLQTALERRGLRTFAANQADHGLALAREHRPDLIVLDLEVDDSSPEVLSAPFAAHARAGCTPLVMLGSARRDSQRLPDGEFVAKPYHYGPLIRKIEELLKTNEG
jgi:DNA-binding response OmpR family regulator